MVEYVQSCFKIRKDKLNKIRHVCVDENKLQCEFINEAIDLKLKAYEED